jgi:GNAT superfamily N-acetyltransferase
VSWEIRELKPDLWPALENLFGPNGACAGCWCIWWRLEKGEHWPNVKGAPAKRRFKALVKSGKAKGLIAFDRDQPVGWLALGPRTEFLRLDRAPSLACDDAKKVWSLPCFYVKSGYRGKGVAMALLKRAVDLLRKRGAKVLEGYPVSPHERGGQIPAVFAYTGTVAMFDAAGFKPADKKERGKRRVRLEL